MPAKRFVGKDNAPERGLAKNGAGELVPPPTERMAKLVGELELVRHLTGWNGGMGLEALKMQVKNDQAKVAGVAKHELAHAMQAFGTTLLAIVRVSKELDAVRDAAGSNELHDRSTYKDPTTRRAARKLVASISKASRWASELAYGAPPKKGRQRGPVTGDEAIPYRLQDIEHHPFIHTALEQVKVEHQKHGDLKKAVRDAVKVHWAWIRRAFEETDPEIRSQSALKVKLRHFARELYKAAQEELGGRE